MRLLENNLFSDANREFPLEESPPKKRRLDTPQLNSSSSATEEKAEADMSTDENGDKTPADKKEEAKTENPEPKDDEKTPATTSATDHSLLLTSTRNDLIKDIESHIEIIYECLDELNDTGSTSSTSKTPAPDAVTPAQEPPATETEKNDGEPEKTEEVVNDDESAAPKESKNE